MVSPRIVAVLAFVANGLLVIGKLTAWGLTGNASVLAQAYHATSNATFQVLVVLCYRPGPSALSPEDRRRRYFLAVVVTTLVFAVAGYASVREGYNALGTPYRDVNVSLNYLVLGTAAVVQLIALERSYRGRYTAGGTPDDTPSGDYRIVQRSAVVVHVVALLGIVFALAGVYATDVTGSVFYDLAAAMLVGALLVGTAFALAYQYAALVTGDTLDADLAATLADIDGITEVLDARVVSVKPDHRVVATELRVSGDLPDIGSEVEATVADTVPDAARLYIETTDGDVTERSLTSHE